MRNRNLRLLELAYGGAITSEWAFTVALGVFAYDEGGATAVGVLGVVRMLPAAVATPLGAAVAERFERERVLVGITSFSAAVVAAAAAAFYAGAGEAAVFVLAALHAAVSTLIRPEVYSLVPSLAATPEQLVAGNGASSMINGLGTLAGPLLAGVVVAVGSAGAVFAAVAAIYLGAALLLASIRVEGRLVVASQRSASGLAAGARLLLRDPRPRLVGILMVAQTAVRGALNVLVVVLAFRVLHAGGGWVGFLSAAVGAGGLVGGFVAVTVVGRRLALPFGVGLVLWGVPIMLLAAFPNRVAALLLLALLGAGNGIEDVSGETLLQRLVPDELLGRVFGLLFGLATGGLALGSIAVPPLLSWLGPRPTLLVVGAFLPLVVLLAGRSLVAIDRTAAVPTRELELVGRVPMFAPLSVAAKEHVAASLVPMHVAAGTPIVTEGEVGDRFYILASGHASVTSHGRAIDRRGPGESFGEIALLRPTPRTATVVADEDAELYSLERCDFVAAVTGHAASVEAADEVIAERLERLRTGNAV